MKLLRWARRFALALFFCAVGGTSMLLALRIPQTGFQSEFDPGPRALPLSIGALLLVGGLVQGLRGARPGESPPEGTLGAFWAFFGALTLYLIVMPAMGFVLSTVLLVGLMAWWLGSRWWAAGLLAIGLVSAVELLFGGLFKVSLPRGILPFPF